MGLGTTLPPLGGLTGSLNLPGVNPQAVNTAGQTGNIPYNQMTDVQKRAYYDQVFS